MLQKLPAKLSQDWEAAALEFKAKPGEVVPSTYMYYSNSIE